jgi:hypothetical protein
MPIEVDGKYSIPLLGATVTAEEFIASPGEQPAQ